MASKKKLYAQRQAAIGKSVRGLKPPPIPVNRERSRVMLGEEIILAASWQRRAKRRVELLFASEHPTSAAKFVELFGLVFGPEKLPYLWMCGETRRGKPNTFFRIRFGAVPPETAGLAGYTKEEEKRRVGVLEAEQAVVAGKYGKANRGPRRRSLTAAEWEELRRELQEEAPKAGNDGQP